MGSNPIGVANHCPEMITNDILDVVERWFTVVRGGSLELPKGWFGRPYDINHELTWSEARAHYIILELDELHLLILTDPTNVDATEYELKIDGATGVVFVWQEGSELEDGKIALTSHLDVHGPGKVEFAAPRGGGRDAARLEAAKAAQSEWPPKIKS